MAERDNLPTMKSQIVEMLFGAVQRANRHQEILQMPFQRKRRIFLDIAGHGSELRPFLIADQLLQSLVGDLFIRYPKVDRARTRHPILLKSCAVGFGNTRLAVGIFPVPLLEDVSDHA
ncbi:hypothetical protein SDC9_145693 [bioreactor metagenome]|uniref:Uncharacterized protein n=1 Tax=bioreactor metagenome TaxID=1076179 RepID=A0A645EAM6_9ZZZZ